MTFSLGLTGSIGMGKSTTAAMFAEEGCAVWDADAAVHRLYAANGAAKSALQVHLPEAIRDGVVSRDALRELITADPTVLKIVESIVHPLVREDRDRFRQSETADILVFDIPLLFETGGDREMDAVACVWVDATVQKRRVLDRGTMTEDQFKTILSKQMPIEEKRARSDFEIHTDTLEHAKAQVDSIIAHIRSKAHA